MNDKDTYKLFFERNEKALKLVDKEYGRYARFIASNILPSPEDSEEAVNDAYNALWNSIPPNKPDSLKAYLAKTVKNISLDKLRKQTAAKRGEGQADAALDELAEVLRDSSTPETELDKRILTETVGQFVGELEPKSRKLFLQRYWYLCSIAQIAKENKMSEGAVKTALYRLRLRLKEQLEREGLL
ncbi:MAG: sigma-70 family RNA polymerase sigma factor [Ruminococcus sp.]|nr:sigma-70 family RNA polymerase sigma factor [Ruminococcus sp.]